MVRLIFFSCYTCTRASVRGEVVMKRNRLGMSEIFVSEIGFGCMSLQVDNEQVSERMIHEAIDAGINFFDTADLYDYGVNEEVVGKALQGRRDKIVLATKVGNRWQEGKEGWEWDPSKQHIFEAVKQSLRRLKTDYIDLYQLHGGTISDPIDETIEAFEQLKREGLIRDYGISSIRPNVIKEFVQRSSIVSVMMQYNMLDRRAEELFNFLAKHEVSVIVRGPVAKGLLTDNWQAKLTEAGYLSYSKQEIIALHEQLEKLKTQERDKTQIALRYALSPEVVATTIPGTSRTEQLQANIRTKDVSLTAKERNEINRFTKVTYYTEHRIGALEDEY